MGGEEYYVWCEMMEMRQQRMICRCSICSTKRSDSNKRMKSCKQNIGIGPLSNYMRQSEEEVLLARQMQLDKGADSTQTSMKRRCGGATMHIRNPEGPSRSLNPSSYIEMTLLVAKAAVSWGPDNPSSA
ncbi:hypothetical protein CK203_106923 [Vitis vinifera]|uniref:Uncharacterized protein n=1 Tax=Vitis vinifera TaxID=29760 RepID=A0A438CDW9_VITVI|nr:hypothetical protein CK203_106923 [Vitis vinifera]